MTDESRTKESVLALLDFVGDIATGLPDESHHLIELGQENPLTQEEIYAQLGRLFHALKEEGRKICDDQGQEMHQDDIEHTIKQIATSRNRPIRSGRSRSRND